MFYDRLLNLCSEKGISITAVLKDIGLGASKNTQWKAGSMPSSVNLSKLANYFDVSTDYLIGNDDIKKRPTSEEMERINRYLQNEKYRELMEIVSHLPPDSAAKVAEYAEFLLASLNRKVD